MMTQKSPSEEEVLAYLKSEKDFFERHPEILNHIQTPEKKYGDGVVDFQSRIVNKLRADNSSAQKMQRDLIETFRANMNNQNRIYMAVLMMLEAESFEEFIDIVTTDFPALLDVDTVNIVIEATSKEVPFVNRAGIRFAKQGTVEKWLGKGDALLQANINGHEEIFGPGAGLVKSHALLRLEISARTPSGILAFGARDPEAFQPNQAIDQIGFLAQVVERCFRLWIDLEE